MSVVLSADVVVIGAGPAGICAATTAAEHGSNVVLFDENREPGGQIWRAASVRKASSADVRDEKKRRALALLQRSGVRALCGRTVYSASASGAVNALHESANGSVVETVHFKRLILATGARERFLPFPGWTLPGVFGAGGLQALVRAGYPVVGKRVVVAGTGPLLLAVAVHLAEDGAQVAAVVEQAPLAKLAGFAMSLWRQPAKLAQGAGYRRGLRSAKYRTGCWVVEAIAASQGNQLSAVRLTDGTRTWTEPCDLLACGYHLVPNTELAALLGCELQAGFVRVDAQQRTSVPNVFCAGEPTGIAGLDAALLQGEAAGLACADKSTDALQRRLLKERQFGRRMEAAFSLRPELRSLPQTDTIVCRCEDVTLHRLVAHSGWTDAKLQTRCGMGPCQGRICGPATEFVLGWKPSASVRQPLYPVPLDALTLPATSEFMVTQVDSESCKKTKERI